MPTVTIHTISSEDGLRAGTVLRIPNRPLKRYRMAFAYDRPYYEDFIVEAASARAALRIAQKALKANRFENVIGTSDDSSQNQRVFVQAQADPEYDKATPTMEQVIKEADEQ